MAKLKYDRPINIGLGKNKYVTVPEGEVWKVSTRQSVNAFATNLYGGVHIPYGRRSDLRIRHRLQARRRVSDSMEVVLHG